MSDDDVVATGAPTLGAEAAHHASGCDCLLCEADDEDPDETDVNPTYGVLGGLR